MMETPHPCPDAALLAAFIDGTLTDFERTAVVAHLVECEECRAVALEVADAQTAPVPAAEPQASAPLPPPPLSESDDVRWVREKTRAPALAVAAAAIVASLAVPLYLLLASWSPQDAVSALMEAAEGQRPIAARLSGGFPYAPPPSTLSSSPAPGAWQLVSVAGRVRDAYEHDYGVSSRRAVGQAALLTGALDDAIASLEIAASADPDDAKVANDLGAAYYERAQRAERPDDLPAALSAVERALTLAPRFREALFNRALTVTALGLRQEAEAAWRDYIAVDGDSPWAEEAAARAAQIRERFDRQRWTKLEAALQESPSDAAAGEAVTDYGTAARNLFSHVLTRWAEVRRVDQAEKRRLEATLRALADAFVKVRDEHYYRDLVTALEDCERLGRGDAFAAAHADFLEALSAPELSSPGKLTAYADLLPRLRSLDSPAALALRVENAATLYLAGRHEEALAILSEIKTEAARRDYLLVLARVAWIEGLAQFGRNQLAAARVAYEAMLDVATMVEDVEQLVVAYTLLANLHDVQGDNTRAWHYRVQAMSRVDELPPSTAKANVFLGSAGQALAGGHWEAALLFQARLLMAESPLNPISEIQVRTQRARALLELNQQAAAGAEVQASYRRLEAVTDAQLRSRIEADLSAVESEMVQQDDPAHALRIAERALALAGGDRDVLRLARLHHRLADAALANGDLDRAEAAIRNGVAALSELRRPEAQGQPTPPSDHELALYARAQEIALLRGELTRAFEYGERRRVREAYEERAWGRERLSLSDVQRQVPAGTAVIVLEQLGERLYTWLIDGSKVAVEAAEVTPRRAATLVKAHLSEISRGVSDPNVSAELYELLLQPISRHLADVTSLVIVADAPYRQIAFAGLWDREQTRYLVEDYRLAVAPTVVSYIQSRNRLAPRMPGNRGNGAAVIAADAGMLHRRDQPEASLADAYAAAQVRTGLAATPTELIAQISKRDVVHVAATIAGSDQAPSRSRLLVADEPGQKYSGAVSADQFAALTQVRAQLVALDSEGISPGSASTEAVQALARSLLVAGVPTVVSSIAGIPGAVLGKAWADFHRNYAQGATAAESVRRAQLAALTASGRRTGAWATLTVFGSTE